VTDRSFDAAVKLLLWYKWGRNKTATHRQETIRGVPKTKVGREQSDALMLRLDRTTTAPKQHLTKPQSQQHTRKTLMVVVVGCIEPL